MCTVTFIPQNNNSFLFTSNRDEAPDRSTIAPEVYTLDNTQVLFPKDEVAGGTWIGLSDKQRLVCLLNGGFTAHERADSYRMSRGLLVTELLTTKDISEAINTYNFNGIEPFTLITVAYETTTQIFELVWDGTTAHFAEKPLQPHIWSSSLLYNKEAKALREAWFSEFIFTTMRPSAKEIKTFHKTAGIGNADIDLIMNRGFVKTKSITQIEKTEHSLWMQYEDLHNQQQTKTTF
ncbi:NRDE family protein [Rasiella rasia]|uniref:NRDE family protein n=1 Tax=Rasiella rasia TaxID=2744027 RepID=A0A6G6GPE9_9FLAO|nr:NRDE family protein [Rasiella rasia]QIE60429.1 NRDE family protein [Rasiella rasia]